MEASWQLTLDEVLLVPVGRPPHRDRPRSDAATRLRLVGAAVADQPALAVSTIEVDSADPSFTVSTLRELARREPATAWTLIIGADQLLAFDTWREPDEIVRLARLGVVARGDVDEADLLAAAGRVAPGRFDLIQVPRIDVSSTLVRERIARGRPFSHLVPGPVAQIIDADGLYGPKSPLA